MRQWMGRISVVMGGNDALILQPIVNLHRKRRERSRFNLTGVRSSRNVWMREAMADYLMEQVEQEEQ